jgi:selenocysteine-specific elongation factor
VILLDRTQLGPGEACLAQLLLQAPVLVLRGDRFILRQFSPVNTIGGGVVLDNQAKRHSKKQPANLGLLNAFEGGSSEEILAKLCDEGDKELTLEQIVSRTGWLSVEVEDAGDKLAQAGKVKILRRPGEGGFLVMSAAELAACVRQMKEEVEKFHTANPLSRGISKEELRARVSRRSREGAVFGAALEELVSRGELELSGDVVKRGGREIQLSAEEARAKEQIEQAFAEAGLTVPPVKDVLGRLAVEDKRAQKILQILFRERVLVKVAEDLIFHETGIGKLRGMLFEYKQKKGARLTIAAFKELSGVSRKYAIPLLEYLDRERVTRRVGDERLIL